MDDIIRYRKPNMANLPADLGTQIIEQILSTPRPDYEKMREEAVQLEREMIRLREGGMNYGNIEHHRDSACE